MIADILNGDTDNSCAYSYDVYPNAKYKIIIWKQKTTDAKNLPVEQRSYEFYNSFVET